MASFNKTKKSEPVYMESTGARAAKQSKEAMLRRSTCACLLGEDTFYENGVSIMKRIHDLIMEVDSDKVVEIMKDAKHKFHLRHTPLYMACCLAEKGDLKAEMVESVITRCDDLSEILAIYWKDGKKPLPKQMQKGIAKAFAKFDEYQFGKYKGAKKDISIRDVIRLCHPTPVAGKFGKTDMTEEQRSELYKKIVNETLATPYTWETELSAGKDKKATWTNLIESKKLGGLATLRNLRNMKEANVDRRVIKEGIKSIHNTLILPKNWLSAASYAPEFVDEIEDAMLENYKTAMKIPGKTLFIVDVSGSMGTPSFNRGTKSYLARGATPYGNRMDHAIAMAILAANQCEDFEFVCTAGSDWEGKGAHEWVRYPKSGFKLFEQIMDTRKRIGGGGIFTRQCLEWCKDKFGKEGIKFDRVIVFSDSQDCDHRNTVPNPAAIAPHSYICDVSSYKNGVNFAGKWTAEISGFSEHFLTYIAASEGVDNQFCED